MLFLVACVVGCSYQCIQISILYFEYPTATRIASRSAADESFESPVLILCSRYETHMPDGTLRSDTTVREILEKTPAADSLPYECYWRSEAGHEKRSWGACLEGFSFRKFYTQVSVCYSVQQISHPST